MTEIIVTTHSTWYGGCQNKKKVEKLKLLTISIHFISTLIHELYRAITKEQSACLHTDSGLQDTLNPDYSPH